MALNLKMYSFVATKNNKKMSRFTLKITITAICALVICCSGNSKIKENKELAEKATILIERKDVIYKTKANIDIVEI